MRLTIACTALLAFGTVAEASLIPSYTGQTAGSTPGTFRWEYRLTLTEDEALDPSKSWSHFFTIFDVNGLVPGSVTSPVDWTSSVQNTGQYGDLIGSVAGDDPSIPNVTWTWTGASFVPGPMTTNGFSFESIYSAVGIDRFDGNATKYVPGAPADGTLTSNTGFASVPQIPEPSSMALLGIAIVGLGLYRSRK